MITSEKTSYQLLYIKNSEIECPVLNQITTTLTQVVLQHCKINTSTPPLHA